MKRFLSFALCLLLVLTQFLALPIGTIAATTHYTVWADADALDHDRLWTMQGGVGGIGRTTKHVQGGKAYAWNRGTTGAASTAVFSAPNRLAGSKNALVFWVDTVDQIAATAAYAIKVYTTTSTGNTTCFRIAAGGTASLISGGSVTPLVCATDSVTLLKDVSGWVVIPFTSFENQWGPETTTATGTVDTLFFQTGTNYGSVVYLDDIGFAADVNAFVSAACNGTLTAARLTPCQTYDHDWKPTVCGDPARCGVCGYVGQVYLGHYYDHYGICSLCGAKEDNGQINADNVWFRTTMNFDGKMPTRIAGEYNIQLSYGLGKAGCGQALRWAKADTTVGGSGTMLYTENGGLAGDDGVAFWLSMKEAGNIAFTQLCFMVHDYAGNVERCWKLKPSAVYYTVQDGVATRRTSFTSQNLAMDGSFEGWVIVPYSSFEHHWGVPAGQTKEQQVLDPVTVRVVDFYNSSVNFTGYMELDEYGCVSDIDEFIVSLGGFPCTGLVVGDMEGAMPTIATSDSAATTLLPTTVDVQQGQGLRIITDGGEVRLTATVTNPQAAASFRGLGFWLSTERAVSLSLRLDGEQGTSLGDKYWLINTVQGVSRMRRVTDNCLDIPAGFAGWVVVDTDGDLSKLTAVALDFDGEADLCVDTLRIASSAAGLITRDVGGKMDTDLVLSADPSRVAVSTRADGTKLISLYEAMTSAAFLRSVDLRAGYRMQFVDAKGAQIYGALVDMSGVTAVEVYLGNVLQTTYLLTVATGSDPCAALGHNWTNNSCATAGVCGVCGISQPADTVGHSWVTSSCTDPTACAVCGAVQTAAAGHNWLAANCGLPKRCAICGETEGEPTNEAHTWHKGACALCGTPLFTIAQDFEGEGGLSYLEGGTATTVSGTPFGDSALQIQRGSTAAKFRIEFDRRGTKEQKALAFWYDLTDSGTTATDYPIYVYPRDFAGNLITLSSENVYYVITDGTVTARTGGLNMRVLLPNRTAGWVVLPIPGNSSWQNVSVASPYYGTMEQLAGINIEMRSYGNSRMVLDHFTFVEDISLFNGMAAAGNINITGCTERESCADGTHRWTVATCGIPAYCTVCGLANSVHTAAHAWADATCTYPKFCTACGIVDGKAPGHAWADATCEAPKTCTACGVTEGKALTHNWQDPTCAAPKTCAACGKTEGEALGHIWTDATCDTPVTCTRCGGTQGEPLGHTWTEATCTTAKTCTTCGEIEGDIPGHAWVAADCIDPKTCAACGKTEGEALGHIWTDATCDTPVTCTRCGGTQGEPPGHTWAEATCMAPRTCSVCGEMAGSASGHINASGTCFYCGIDLRPKITAQPKSISVTAGDKQTFTVNATGNDIKYCWQINTGGSWKNTTTTGYKTKTITVSATAARNGYQYRCIITDRYGNKVTTSAAKLTVVSPKITKNPASRKVTAGDKTTFSVTATGNGLKYRWQINTGSGWKNTTTTGYKTKTITVSATAARNGYQYRCVVTDENGNKVVSTAAKLTAVSPKITKQPVSIKANKNTAQKFTVTATGNGLTYRWQVKTPSGSWKNTSLAGCRTRTLSVKALTKYNGYQYRCIITDENGNKIISKAVKLTVR
ncbi:MAG: hypothetical protein IJO76_01700 [Clostridia bacterium]|nr:hypothetical protein [Clostridia bacterium]